MKSVTNRSIPNLTELHDHPREGEISGRNETILGLGTATLLSGYGLGASALNRSEKASLLRTAIEGGIRYIDTASAYGECEELLGEQVSLLKGRQVRVCTKINSAHGYSKAETSVEKVKASMRRLRLENLDTVLLHSARRDDLRSPQTADAFDIVKRECGVHLTGGSTYGLDDAGAAVGLPWCDVLQVEYSILNQSVVRAILPSLRQDQELVVRSVMCKGLLTGRRWCAPDLLQELGSVIDELEEMATGWGYSLPELAIRFALDTPRVNVVLVGVSSTAELDVALRARDRTPLSHEQMQMLGEFDYSDIDCVHPERWEKGLT